MFFKQEGATFFRQVAHSVREQWLNLQLTTKLLTSHLVVVL